MAYDLSYYQNKAWRLGNQISSRKTENKKIQKEIDRLQAAYNAVKRLKNDEADPLRRDVELKKCGKDLEWRAKSKENFDNHVDGTLKQDAKNLYSSVDRTLDEINTAIGKKKGQIDTGNSIINDLNRSLQSINYTIRNWFN